MNATKCSIPAHYFTTGPTPADLEAFRLLMVDAGRRIRQARDAELLALLASPEHTRRLFDCITGPGVAVEPQEAMP